MIKKILLFFLCISLFLSIADCKKKLPTSPDLPKPASEILAPIIEFSADTLGLLYGNSTQLTWIILNVTKAEMSVINLETNEQQNLGKIGSQGDMEITPKARTVYTINAWNQDKTASKSVEINVCSGANLQVIGSLNVIFERFGEYWPYTYGFKWDITLKNIGNLAASKIRIDVIFVPRGYPSVPYSFYFYDALMPNEQQYFEGSYQLSENQYAFFSDPYFTARRVELTWEPN